MSLKLACCVALVSSDDYIYAVNRRNQDIICFPGGKADEDESIIQCTLRELYEETGIVRADILEISEEKLRYDFPAGFTNKYLVDHFRGQEQTWVALRFSGEDSEINLNAHTPPEFSAWQWLDLDRIVDLIVPFKRDLYREVIRKFSKYSSA